MADGEPTAEVVAVSLRLPKFWPAHPQVWFVPVESQFVTARVTSQIFKLYHVTAALPPEVAMEVRDFVIATPEDTRTSSLLHHATELRVRATKTATAANMRRTQRSYSITATSTPATTYWRRTSYVRPLHSAQAVSSTPPSQRADGSRIYVQPEAQTITTTC